MEYELVGEQDRDPLIGETLGERFEVRGALSEGGMSKVYRGIQRGIDREVAIKVLRADPGSDDTKVRRFLREARAISKLSDPNIVNFIDFGQDNRHGALYLVMELIEGCELAELMEDARLDPALVVEVGLQVCSALTEPHHEGVVHRDLKPANLMLLPRLDGSLLVKLVDFGIANQVQGQTRLTKTGVACGTPHYMAPEQIEGDETTPTIDIYGLGAILHFMLSGRVVFDAETDVKILFKHLKERPPELRTFPFADEFPERLCDLVRRMLSKDSGRRPDSVLEVRDELEAVRCEEGYEPIRLDLDREPPDIFDPWVIEDPAGQSAPIERAPATGQRASPHETGGVSAPAGEFEGERTQVDPNVQERIPEPGAAGPGGETTTETMESPQSPGREDRDPSRIAGDQAETPTGRVSPQSDSQADLADVLAGQTSEGERPAEETWDLAMYLNVGLSILIVAGVAGGLALWTFGGEGKRGEVNEIPPSEESEMETGAAGAAGNEPEGAVAPGERDAGVESGDAGGTDAGDAGADVTSEAGDAGAGNVEGEGSGVGAAGNRRGGSGPGTTKRGLQREARPEADEETPKRGSSGGRDSTRQEPAGGQETGGEPARESEAKSRDDESEAPAQGGSEEGTESESEGFDFEPVE